MSGRMAEVPQTFPDLRSGQVAILMAEAATGIVLMPSGERMLRACPVERFQVFDSLEEARSVCEKRVGADPKVEFLLFDAEGEYIDAVRAPVLQAEPTRCSSLWSLMRGLFIGR